jgi:hypothetical protein
MVRKFETTCFINPGTLLQSVAAPTFAVLDLEMREVKFFDLSGGFTPAGSMGLRLQNTGACGAKSRVGPDRASPELAPLSSRHWPRHVDRRFRSGLR